MYDLNTLIIIEKSLLSSSLRMAFNKTAIIALLVGFIIVGLSLLFNPTWHFPSVSIKVTLKPGQNFTLGIPKNSGLQWLVTAFSDPAVFIETDVKDLAIEGIDKLLPNTILGILPILLNASTHADGGDSATIYNSGNSTVNATVKGTRMPPPDQLQRLSNGWSIFVSIVPLLFAMLITYLKPAPTVNVTHVAPRKSGQASASPLEEPTCGCARNHLVAVLRSCCLHCAK